MELTLVQSIELTAAALSSLACCYGIYREADLIRFENRVWQKTKRGIRGLIRAVQAQKCENKTKRSGKMFIILKTPGEESERLHNIRNDLKAVAREIDAVQPEYIEVPEIPCVYMAYDATAFERSETACVMDADGGETYYGTVAFFAMDANGYSPRGLTEREADEVEEYIEVNRVDDMFDWSMKNA